MSAALDVLRIRPGGAECSGRLYARRTAPCSAAPARRRPGKAYHGICIRRLRPRLALHAAKLLRAVISAVRMRPPPHGAQGHNPPTNLSGGWPTYGRRGTARDGARRPADDAVGCVFTTGRAAQRRVCARPAVVRPDGRACHAREPGRAHALVAGGCSTHRAALHRNMLCGVATAWSCVRLCMRACVGVCMAACVCVRACVRGCRACMCAPGVWA